jgi:hypothetical protein
MSVEDFLQSDGCFTGDAETKRTSARKEALRPRSSSEMPVDAEHPAESRIQYTVKNTFIQELASGNSEGRRLSLEEFLGGSSSPRRARSCPCSAIEQDTSPKDNAPLPHVFWRLLEAEKEQEVESDGELPACGVCVEQSVDNEVHGSPAVDLRSNAMLSVEEFLYEHDAANQTALNFGGFPMFTCSECPVQLDLANFKTKRCSCGESISEHQTKTCHMYHHHFDKRRPPGTYSATPCEHEFHLDDSRTTANGVEAVRHICPLGYECTKCHNII